MSLFPYLYTLTHSTLQSQTGNEFRVVGLTSVIAGQVVGRRRVSLQVRLVVAAAGDHPAPGQGKPRHRCRRRAEEWRTRVGRPRGADGSHRLPLRLGRVRGLPEEAGDTWQR